MRKIKLNAILHSLRWYQQAYSPSHMLRIASLQIPDYDHFCLLLLWLLLLKISLCPLQHKPTTTIAQRFQKCGNLLRGYGTTANFPLEYQILFKELNLSFSKPNLGDVDKTFRVSLSDI